MDPGSTILITGGTGLLGNALTNALLQRGFSVIILTRNPGEKKSNHPQLTYAGWDVQEKIMDTDSLAKADYIIHLAGESLAEKRWTKKRKEEIVDSRVDSSRLIIESLSTIPNNVKAVFSASATGWYGSDSTGIQTIFKEADPSANDFLGQTCRQWEAAIDSVIDLGKRLVKFRIGIVLSNDGGALKEFKRPFRFGIAAIPGSGKQIISWIHIDDLVRLFLFALDNEQLSGTFNAVAPFPVSNKELVLKLAEKERGRYFIPVHIPSFVIKLVFGEISSEVLKSAAVSAEKIEQAGFIFQFPNIDNAIRQLLDS